MVHEMSMHCWGFHKAPRHLDQITWGPQNSGSQATLLQGFWVQGTITPPHWWAMPRCTCGLEWPSGKRWPSLWARGLLL